MTHRALVAAALADGESCIESPLDAVDTRVTLQGLGNLGIETRVEPAGWIVEGRGGSVPGGAALALRESGTSLRLLSAVAALGARPSSLDGAPRLRERPIVALCSALGGLGAHVETDPRTGGLPLTLGGRAVTGGTVQVDGSETSQFASAILLIGSRLPRGIEMGLPGAVVSRGYIDMTEDLLAEFGVPVLVSGKSTWSIEPTDYPGRTFRVEGDHSAASYLLASSAIVGGSARVTGLNPDSRQPDARLAKILEQAGCAVERGSDWIEVRRDGGHAGFEEDVAASPDLVPTLAVLAAFADGPTHLTGTAHLRLKESDRVSRIVENLRAIGCEADAGPDEIRIRPARGGLRGARIETASDHRIAMAFAIGGLAIDGIEIDDPSCVDKSNPWFWEQLARLERGEGPFSVS